MKNKKSKQTNKSIYNRVCVIEHKKKRNLSKNNIESVNINNANLLFYAPHMTQSSLSSIADAICFKFASFSAANCFCAASCSNAC